VTTTVRQLAEINAPASWRTVDFISDLHLQASEPATFSTWRRYMQSTPADAVFILGDLFEVWVGDDVVDAPGASPEPGFERRCADVLRAAAQSRAIFFMHGNRDFLVGDALMTRCHTQLLCDPCMLAFAGQRWLLSHGDALCLDDVPYQQFRRIVRSAAWQTDFVSKPLAERQALARNMRQQSQANQQTMMAFADADTDLSRQWLDNANAHTLIHGHTHRPADHQLGTAQTRRVLSDWDAAACPPRAQVLRLTSTGVQRIDLLLTADA
jgi:UDP-2,3-diacylglucosamine hydrolase